MKRMTYSVVLEAVEDGWWMASVPGVPGVRTQGRSLHEARARVRDALALAIGDGPAAKAALVDDLRLPIAARNVVRRARAARRRAEQEEQKASASTVEAARMLTRHMGFSVRDAGELLGISHQRVQQLVSH